MECYRIAIILLFLLVSSNADDLKAIRVLTRNNEPFIYRNAESGQFLVIFAPSDLILPTLFFFPLFSSHLFRSLPFVRTWKKWTPNSNEFQYNFVCRTRTTEEEYNAARIKQLKIHRKYNLWKYHCMRNMAFNMHMNGEIYFVLWKEINNATKWTHIQCNRTHTHITSP